MTHRFNLFVLILLLALALPWYWLFIENNPGTAVAKDVSIAQLRALATSQPGRLPERIRFETTGAYDRMGNLVAAGSGMRVNRHYRFAYLIDFNDRAPVLVGSGSSRKQADALGDVAYFAAAQARVEGALHKAAVMVPLDPGPAQTGGLSLLRPAPDKARLEGALQRMALLDAGMLPYALAPGVVVIPTPGWRDGSRLVYVRTGEGREYILAGDLSRIRENWSQLRAPAAYFTSYTSGDNRQEIFAWLMTLRKLKAQAPRLAIVSGARIPASQRIEQFFPDTNSE